MGYKRFLLLSHLRSGTHMLRSALESHPEIRCQGEVFNSDSPNLPYPLTTPAATLLRDWVFKAYEPPVRWVGFVLQSYHPWGLAAFQPIRENPSWADVWDLLGAMEGLRVIHLKRRNLLARHLSHLGARASGRWHHWDARRLHRVTHLEGVPETRAPAAGGAGSGPIRLDPRRLEIDFEDVERARARAERDLAMHPMLEVFYEDLCRDFQAQSRRVLAFLGCAQRRLEPATFKLERARLCERIANYRELQAYFSGSRWEEFFED